MTANSSMDQIQLLQLIMDNIPQFIFWKDTQSVYLGCNMNFARVAGLKDPAEIVGKVDYDLPWSKEESDFYREVDRRVMDSGKAEINFEEPQTQYDGQLKWLRTSKIPLRDHRGNPIGILGTYEDITERKNMEIALQKAAHSLDVTNSKLKQTNADLEQANIDLEQFAFAISHDLQEPLRMIGGFSSLLRKRYEDKIAENDRTFFSFMQEGVQRMSTLIKGSLSYTRLGKEEFKTSLVDLNALVTDQLVALSELIRAKQPEIEIDLPGEPIHCQPQQIGLLFYHLIQNALKFNESQVPKIQISHQKRELDCLIQVADNGIGIPESVGDQIYKAFKRLHSRKFYEGSGIGLSVCKRIILLHQGKIWHEPNAWNGTSCCFTLPKIID